MTSLFRLNQWLSIFCCFLICGSLSLDQSATFEMNIFSLYTSPDSTVFCESSRCPVRVCLKQFQRDYVENEPCTFGQVDLDFDRNSTAFLSIYERIPEDFTLVLSLFGRDSDSKPISSMAVPIRGNFYPSTEFKKQDFVFNFTESRKVDAVVDVKFRLTCSEFHFGKDCSTICVPPFDGRYTCDARGQKVCRPGTGGANCESPDEKCSSSCKNGLCDGQGHCQCFDGYRGERCDQCVPSPGCKGTCSKPYECICLPGFGGKNCSHDLTECIKTNLCRNGATCDLTFDGHPICICPPGFAGDRCERKISSCDANPCRNGGECGMLPENIDYHCKCPAGFTGRFCQIKAETCRDRPCMNGAVCKSPTDSGFICECTNKWMGTNCDIPITRCSLASCFNGGKCFDDFSMDLGFRCECEGGHYGSRCQSSIFETTVYSASRVDVCEGFKCLNGGTCSGQKETGRPTCSCPQGFRGDHCEVDLNECPKNPCQHGRSCLFTESGSSCECPRGFYGEQCQHEMPIVSMHDRYGQRREAGYSEFLLGVVTACILLVAFGILYLVLKARYQAIKEKPVLPQTTDVHGLRPSESSRLRMDSHKAPNAAGKHCTFSNSDPCSNHLKGQAPLKNRSFSDGHCEDPEYNRYSLDPTSVHATPQPLRRAFDEKTSKIKKDKNDNDCLDEEDSGHEDLDSESSIYQVISPQSPR